MSAHPSHSATNATPRIFDRITCTSAKGLFGVRNDGQNDIFIALDFEVKAPVPGHSSLPYVERFAVFLRVQGRMVAIEEQETHLFPERLSNDNRHVPIVLVGFPGEAQLHVLSLLVWRLARASSAAIASSALAYGPWVLPVLAS